MIYLYESTETDFTYNGKPLPKAYDVPVNFKINEENFVTGKHPLDKEEIYKEIKEDRIITVNTPDGMQPFRILKPIKEEKYVRFEAWPLFLADMRNKLIKPLNLTNADGTSALISFKNNLLIDTPFYFTSDITEQHNYHTQDTDERIRNPNQLYNALDVFKAIVARWGGEVRMNGYDVRILKRLGTNTQSLLYEKKNISRFIDETNIEGVVTRLYGKSEWTDDPEEGKAEGKKHVIETSVDSPLIDAYSGIIYERQYTNNNIRTEEEMKKWLNLKFTTENIDKPKRTIEATTNIVDGHYLSVGDTLILKYIKHNVDMTIRMDGYQYDGFDDRYINVTLGDTKTTVSKTINRDIGEAGKGHEELRAETLGWLDDIRKSIVNSYFNEDGYNYDLQADNEYGLPGGYYSFDAPIYENPSKVIYMGAGRLLIANSKNSAGEWNWRTAATGDGFVADVMNTGTLNADFVRIISEDANITIDRNGFLASHDDGTSTSMSPDGFRRHTPSDNRNYHYLMYATTFIYGDTSSNARWIQLPNDFKGKDFQVYLAAADSLNAISYYRSIQRIVATGHPNHSIDYKNARVPIIAYKSETLGDGVEPEITNIQGMLLAIY